MAGRVSERPEGMRTSVQAASGWRLAREIAGILGLWVLMLYIMSRRQGSVSEAAIMTAIGCFVALLAGCGLESMVMRKSATKWIGCFAIAAWGAWLPFAPTGPWLAILGLAGLAIVGATSTAWRTRNAEREREFLAAHAAWRVWRPRMRKLLVGGMTVGLGLSVLTGLWNSVSTI